MIPRGLSIYNFRGRRGISLLEVILAIAILGGSLAALSNVVLLGADAALDARDRAVAQMLCEQQMAEMLVNKTQPLPISDMPLPSTDPSSVCTLNLETQMAPLNGLLAVRISVSVGPADASRVPVTVSLVRWMIDPSLGLEQLEAEEQAAADQAAGAAPAEPEEGL